MAQQWKLRRGTTSENDAFTGVEGEVTVDTTEHTLRVHDGTTPGGHVVGSNSYHPNLFDWKWTDHQLDDVEWLRADTFSWQSGLVYEAAYQHLLDDFNNIPREHIVYVNHNSSPTGYFYRDSYFDVSGAVHPYAYVRYNNDGSMLVLYANHTTGESSDYYYENADGSGPYYFGNFSSGTIYIRPIKHETINGTVISFYKAQDGHKIAPERTLLDISDNRPMLQSTNVASIYNDTGVAWYYILDTINQRFKLPRTKFGATGLRDSVGKYVEAGLPDHTHDLTSRLFRCDYHSAGNDCTYEFGSSTSQVDVGVTQGVSTNSVYGNSDTVQPKATQMYLYFYMGAFTQEAIVNTAGINTEIINDFSAHRVIAFQAPTTENNYTWYRKYADGWVEQGGGGITNNKTLAVTLPIEMQNVYYNVQVSAAWDDAAAGQNEGVKNKDVHNFTITTSTNSVDVWWEVKGMAAQGE